MIPVNIFIDYRLIVAETRFDNEWFLGIKKLGNLVGVEIFKWRGKKTKANTARDERLEK